MKSGLRAASALSATVRPHGVVMLRAFPAEPR